MKRLCRVLGVNRSSYYKWRDGAEARAARERSDQALAERIRAVHAESGGAYGSPRVTAELRETLQGAHRYDGARSCRLTVFRWLTRYNTRRRHSANGQLSPIDYERRHQQMSAIPELAA